MTYDGPAFVKHGRDYQPIGGPEVEAEQVAWLAHRRTGTRPPGEAQMVEAVAGADVVDGANAGPVRIVGDVTNRAVDQRAVSTASTRTERGFASS